MVSSSVAARRPPPRATRPASRPPARARRRRSRARGLWPLLLVAALVAAVALSWRDDEVTPSVLAGCTVPRSDVTVTTEQAAAAATIAAVARSRGLPQRATVIALATAQQESRLRNLDYGDRDSLGLFQQRPSQGWGTEAQVQDPVYSAGKFFDGLVEVPGWETGRLTEVAQAVQRSGFPEAYQQWEPMASALAGALAATEAGALACGYPPGAAGDPAARTAALTETARREAGAPTTEADGTVTIAGAGWPEATWAVAHAERFGLTRVSMDGWAWTPGGGWVSTPSAFELPLQLRLV
ncbi:hypothetical protein [uncultured Modestobacter sp.]|uniref:hypothetical protein n=1 Tax=uncultured Modestobacter sp. TaxID=380048 RepID=UPI00261C9D5C|nr:hypothetical protein [uncultured Modestobacter sp.]